MIFTCVSSKGQSVVDYCIVSYENPHLLEDFKVVRGSDMITNDHEYVPFVVITIQSFPYT